MDFPCCKFRLKKAGKSGTGIKVFATEAQRFLLFNAITL